MPERSVPKVDETEANQAAARKKATRKPVLEPPVRKTPTAKRPRARKPDAPPDPRHVFGRLGEDAAAEFLRRRGMEVLARNVRTAFGEIDLVAMDGDVVVFVEVKSRRRAGALDALAAVDARKQKRLSRLALVFLARAGWLDRAARFDVVAVAGDGACTHVANAFDCAPGN